MNKHREPPAAPQTGAPSRSAGKPKRRRTNESEPDKNASNQNKRARLDTSERATPVPPTESGTTVASEAAEPPSPPATAATSTEKPDDISVVLKEILPALAGRYDVRNLCIKSASAINRKVETALEHLSRVDMLDNKVLPGVVVAYARAPVAGKLVSVMEIAKRRIREGEQKWYQYNRVDPLPGGSGGAGDPTGGAGEDTFVDTSVIEETVLKPGWDEGVYDEDERASAKGRKSSKQGAADGLTGRGRGNNGRAAQARPEEELTKDKAGPPTAPEYPVPLLTIILSRVPIPELRGRSSYTEQSNDAQIVALRNKRWGRFG
jgi:hypothetical protein